MRKIFTIVAFLLLTLPAIAQVDKKEVRSGNRLFRKENYREADIEYRKALVKDSLSLAANHNLAANLYRMGDYQSAAQQVQKISSHPEVLAGSEYSADFNYNAGDIALQLKDYATAVAAFKESLLKNPADMEAKENYIYAKEMLKNQQNQEQQDQEQQDNQQDNQQDQEQQNQDQQQNQQPQPQPQQGAVSPQQAQQMLRAIQAKEKETQDKVNKEKAAKMQSRQKEKNW